MAACINKQAQDVPLKTFTERLREIPRRLTEFEAVFRLETLYRAAAVEALESGMVLNEIDREVCQFLNGDDIVEIGQDEIGIPLYSTPEMIEVENDLVATAQRGRDLRRHCLSVPDVNLRLQSSNLTSEQRMAVEFVTMGADIAVMEGRAGAGKTHALRSVADAYRDGGYRVLGTSTAWRMANQLGDDLNIESKAMDAWLAQDKIGNPFLDDKTVLIVDEAGQLSSRQMLKVLRAAEKAQAKVIFTGDQRQLQAIGAGPGLRLVAEQVGMVRIATIVRQREAWARKAVEDLSLGHADKAISAFEQRNALQWCDGGVDAVEAAVSDWKSFKSSNPVKTALIMAKTNKQVRALNTQMRLYLRAAGQLRGGDCRVKAADASGRAYDLDIAIGDQVMFKKRIEGAGHKFSMDVQGHRIEFTTSERADDKGRVPLAHGYAATVYSSQGATVDSAYVVADHSMKRNEIYVAASRARDGRRLYLDRDRIEKSVRSQMPLSDAARSTITKEQLRQHLSEAWAWAQIKSSTRDFDHVAQPSVMQRQEKLAPKSVRKNTRIKMFQMEVER